MNIHDIAKLAGVSASTVSKVMNGKDKDISEGTRKRVLQIIEHEQYVPYLKFREKQGLKSRLIGLILKRNNREREGIALSAQAAAGKLGYGLLISYTDTYEDIQKSVEEMTQKHVSGLLIDSKDMVLGRKSNHTTVYLSQTKEFDERQKATFYFSLSEAGRLAAERLMQEGHEKIACITLAAEKTVQGGYKKAMRNASLPIQPLWICEGDSITDLEQRGLCQCLNEHTTAVICGSPEVAVCFCKAMERIRITIPDSLSMITIGDSRWMELLENGITTVKLPAEEMVRDAAEYLIHMIQEEKQAEVIRKFTPSLVERKSITRPTQEKQGAKLVVVGSMNMDITVEVLRIPVNGETQLAQRVYSFPGGKGGNQAVGAGKLGGQVYMVGRLGNDVDGRQLFSSLAENHVHMDGVQFDTELPSGKAYINVDRNGESTIVVYEGANRSLSIEQIDRCKTLFQKARYCLLSLEITQRMAEYTIKFCKQTDTEVILKPSGRIIPEELLKDIAYFIPNEHELHTFVPGRQTLEEKAKILRQRGVKHVIVTLGSRGCYLNNQEYSMYFDGADFEAVDTTGGADSFISALAVYLSEGKHILQAIGFAIYASGISVTRYGVQPALPDRKMVDIYEDEIFLKYNMEPERKEDA